MRRLLFLLIFIVTLSGCTYYAPPGENHASRVVTQIDVTAAREGQLTAYHYRDQEKMQQILDYLRQAKPGPVVPITPHTFRTDAYEIRLTFSDGTQTVYHQIYDQYLKKDGGIWQSIDTVQGSMLQPLLLSLPSDQA